MVRHLTNIFFGFCFVGLLSSSVSAKNIVSPDFLFERYESKCESRHELKPYISKSNNEPSLDMNRISIETFLRELLVIIMEKNKHLLNGKFNEDDFCFDVYDKWFNAVAMISKESFGQIHFGAKLFTSAKSVDEIVFLLSHELAHFFLSHTNALARSYTLVIHPELFTTENKKVFRELNKLSGENKNIYDYHAPLYIAVDGVEIEASKYLYELQNKSNKLYGFNHKHLHELEADEIGAKVYKNTGFPQDRDLLLFTMRNDDCLKQNSEKYINTCERNVLVNKSLSNNYTKINNDIYKELQESFLKIKREYKAQAWRVKP